MATGADPIRLAWAILLFILPVAAGYRFSRRFNSSVGAVTDGLLFAYAIEYLAIVPVGFVGWMRPGVISVIGIVLSAVLLVRGKRARNAPHPSHRAGTEGRGEGKNFARPVVLTCFFFVVGYLSAFLFDLRYLPPVATDALAYHLPAAVQWLQHGRIDLLPTWFFNPANTFSPLGGSVFITWLMAPVGNDVLARFVQIGPMFLIFFAMLDLNPRQRAVGAICALAAVLSRPLLAEGALPKDDLFVAAFFAVAAGNLSVEKLREPLGPWRVGISIGLLLAMKYTAILSGGLLLLACDAPVRAGWKGRQWGIAVGLAALLAGPWYLRNLVLTGNPVFPIRVLHLPGMFVAGRSFQLQTVDGLWGALAAGFFALPGVLWILLGIFWVVAVARSGGLIFRDPQRRLILLAPPIGIALFAFFSPYAEVRFVIPEIVLLFGAIPIALEGNPVLGAVAIVPAVISIATSFSAAHRLDISQYTVVGAVVVLAGIALWRLDVERLGLWRGMPRLTAGVALAAAFLAMNHWGEFLANYRQGTPEYWQFLYGDLGELWGKLDAAAPADARVAYANQFMIYPLYGFEGKRRVVYAPVRAGLRIQDLHMEGTLSGEEIDEAAGAAANADADRGAWIKNLRASGAEYLVAGADGPEIAWADGDAGEFQVVFRNSAGVIYRVTLSSQKRIALR
jgi:hypothetical protein